MDILGLEPAWGHRPLSQMRAPTVEKRVVNTLNGDCVAYTLAEFQAFFGDAWQDYWENGLRLRSSSVRAFPSVDERSGRSCPFRWPRCQGGPLAVWVQAAGGGGTSTARGCEAYARDEEVAADPPQQPEGIIEAGCRRQSGYSASARFAAPTCSRRTSLVTTLPVVLGLLLLASFSAREGQLPARVCNFGQARTHICSAVGVACRRLQQSGAAPPLAQTGAILVGLSRATARVICLICQHLSWNVAARQP